MKIIKKLSKQSNKKGFTLIEMLIVLLVVSVLMAVIIPNVAGQRDRINEQAKENLTEIIQTQANTYEMVNDDEATIEKLSVAGYITERQKEQATELGVTLD